MKAIVTYSLDRLCHSMDNITTLTNMIEDEKPKLFLAADGHASTPGSSLIDTDG